MKKVLLSLACVSAMVASAQETKIAVDASAVLSDAKEKVATAVFAGENKVNAPQRMAADGVYYRTPVGALWRVAERPMYSYNAPFLTLPAWRDFTFLNMGTTKKGTWGMQTASQLVDMTEYADENNNLVYKYSGGGGTYYGFQYTEGTITYLPKTDKGEGVINYIASGLEYQSFVPTNVGDVAYYGGNKQISTGLLCGTGSLTLDDGTYTLYGVKQDYPRPMSPLYVDMINIWGDVKDASVISPLSGKTLTMKIYNLEDANAEPVELTCTSEECILDRTTTSGSYFKVNFTKKIVDDLSGETVADPFVIDYPFEIEITGFDQEGVHLGLMGWGVSEEFLSDNTKENTLYFMGKGNGEDVGQFYYETTVLAACFHSMFDICDVETEAESTTGVVNECNGIKVSDDGQTFSNNAYNNVEGVIVCTALDWKDATTGEEMYWSDDMYNEENSWIQNLVVKAINENVGGYYYVGAVCDQLPSNVDKRYAVIHLNGRGVTSEDIFVLQGNITLAEAKEDYANTTGINEIKNDAVKANNKKFNLAGQQVDNSFKGIVISNGKKVIKNK